MTHENELLVSFARRLQQEPDFMAHILRVYLEQEHIGEDQLAAQLGIDGGSLNRLRTCRAPRAAPEHFGADVQRIAQFTGADVTTLARVIRTATAVAGLQKAPVSQQPVTSSSPVPLLRPGLLAAARDREADTDATTGDNPPSLPPDEEF